MFDSVCCDWLSFRHEYLEPVEPRNGGLVMKIDPDGQIEWESASWESIRCPSSDTSIRVKCDGKRLYGSANIGRFMQRDNREGLTVIQCVERWAEVLRVCGFDLTGFGTRWRQGTPAECGTYLTRIDLAGNFHTDDFSALCYGAMVRRIDQKLPMLGKYGPTWGYDAKRSNWWRAKIYDKTAELAGKRRSDGGATDGRFEIQLGSEYLKRHKLDQVSAWKGEDMAQIVYGRFADQVFREALPVTEWDDLPPRLQHWATLWREGKDLRAKLSTSGYYKVRSQLKEYGIDIGAPCNVVALVQRTRTVEVTPISALREVA